MRFSLFTNHIPAFSYFKNIIQKMENEVNKSWQKSKNNFNKKSQNKYGDIYEYFLAKSFK